MNLPKIAFKIEDRVYRLDASDGPEIRKMPKQDRQHLLTLMAAIQKQERQLEGVDDDTSHAEERPEAVISQEPRPSVPEQNNFPKQDTSVRAGSLQQVKQESRDADQIMARLIADEKKNSKSFSKRQLYIGFSVATLIILLLLLMFI